MAWMWTGLLMGLAGGPHCLAMCGAACSALGRPAAVAPVTLVRDATESRQASRPSARDLIFLAGRLLGYALAGAAAAWAVQSMAWLSTQTGVLRPVWTLFHVAVLVWGAALLVQARQPVWVHGAARAVWLRVRPLTARGGGVLASGVLWALMPCGLLYSALLVAGLSGGVLQGAGVMAAFALGSGLALLLGPWLWRLARQRVDALRQDWGTRLAGLALCALAGWALWMDLSQRISQWCQ